MYFCYLFAVVLVINSAANCEVIENGIDANFSPSNFTSTAYHLSVPLPTRAAVTTVLILLLFTSVCVRRVWHKGDASLSMTKNIVDAVATSLVLNVISIGLAFAFAPKRWEFASLISDASVAAFYGSPFFVSTEMTSSRKVSICFGQFAFKILLTYVIVSGVYVEIFSALIPLAILLAIGYVGANQISNLFGMTLFNVATAYLMLVVNVKLLATLNSALDGGKSIWPLISTVIKTVLIVFAIRSISIAHICKWSRLQVTIETYISHLLLLAFHLSFNCVLGYLICLVYSLSAN